MPDSTNQKPCPSGRFWIVQPGDTFYLMASFAGTTTAELERLNPDSDPANLQIGQQICLPPERICPSGVFWVVNQGDTLYTIALATGTTIEDLLELNPYIDPLKLLPGQTICLPK
ncbi:LysM peptidoglycan-binding domain-containing protein [Desulfoscipio gibsoniae]|uniref:Putative glycosyl hydrolase n=1 Tax=Desulfoscipio gibsoniae DSM 7213 TaxID=767817 RepID=R4KRA4_9FIRM|nr:LysM domain-containing protein [Desulfoscipio gibsoniae]AGL02146.1 putative glycosyl hydrolase [Desulfoscipio gibsoniae DSM 7213]